MTKFAVDSRVRVTDVYAAGTEDDPSMTEVVGREGVVVEAQTATSMLRVKLDKPIIYPSGELFYPEELELV